MSQATTATLVLWRHGLTAWNAGDRFQGCNADIALNDEGLAQAAAAAPAVAARQPDQIICSPLRRARQTAAAVEVRLGQSALIDDRLREIDVGGWVGLTTAEVERRDPGYAAARRAGRDYRQGETGETAVELGRRVGASLRQCARDGAVVLVVSHGWALQMGTADLLGWDYPQSRALRAMGNCAISVLTRHVGRWRIDQWNTQGQPPGPE